MPGFVKISIGVLLSTAIAVVLLLYFSFGSRIEDAGYSFSDSIHYLFMADYFFGARDAATSWVALNAYHPPLFPLFLGAFGGGADAITLSHLLTYSTLAMCAAASFWWFASVGLKVNERLALVMLFLVLPGTFLQSMMIVSEYLFLTLLLCSLASSSMADRNVKWLFLAAVFCGLSIATRTVGIAMLPAILLACRGKGFKLTFTLLGTVLIPIFIWKWIREPGGRSDSYLEIFLNYFTGSEWAVILNNFLAHLKWMFQAWIWIFDRWMSTHVVIIQVILLAVAALVLWFRLVRLKPDAVFLLVYLGIIALWPFPSQMERFLVILIPFFLAYVLLGLGFLMRKLGLSTLEPIIKTALVTIFVITILPTLLFYYDRYQIDAPEEIFSQRHVPSWYENLDDESTIYQAIQTQRILSLLAEIPEYLADDECFYTTSVDLATLYTRLPAKQIPMGMYDNLDSEEPFDVQQLPLCDYIVFINLRVIQVPDFVPMYPFLAVKDVTVPVVATNMSTNGVDHIIAALARFER